MITHEPGSAILVLGVILKASLMAMMILNAITITNIRRILTMMTERMDRW